MSMTSPWNPNSHGFTTTGPISTPEASSDVTNTSPNSANSANSNTSMVPSTTSSPTLQDPPTGHSKEGPAKEEVGHGQSQTHGAGSMLSVHQQQQQQQLQMQQSAGALQRPPSSASTSSVASFHTGASSVVHHPPHLHHASAQMGGNNHMPPQYRHPNHHHPHAQQSHHLRHGEQMMGAVRGQGHPHNNHGQQQHMQNNNYHHQPGLVRPAGRYPVQHSGRGGDGYVPNMHTMHGHVQHGRPGPVSNYQFHQQQQQQQHQYHSFPPQGPHAVPGPAVGMDQGGSRGPSPTSHQQQQQHPSHAQKSQASVPPGVAVAIAQSQPLRRLPTNENANNTSGVNNGLTHGDPNHPSNFRGHGGPHQAKQQPSQQQHQQQQQSGPVQSPPNPQVQDHDMGGQEHHRHHPGPSAMHQRYSSHQLQHQQHPQHDQLHYGGQPSMHHGVHPNGMHTDMHHYNYHHPSQGGAGPPHVQNQYHGHPDNRFPAGYPHRAGGHGEMYPHGHPQHHFQHLQHQPNGYGQPLPHPPPPIRAPGHGFQLPKYNASRATGDMTATASKTESAQPMSRSPSPPPSPPPAPSAQALLRQKLREQGAKKDNDQPVATSTAAGETSSSKKGSDSMSISGDSIRRNSSGSHASNTANKPMALGDRGNVAATTPSFGAKKPVTDTTNKTPKTEDITADAASILLQLSGGPENQNPGIQSSPPIPSSVQRSTSMDDVSEAGTMLTMHTEAPDLTSEPSIDSIDSESNIGNKLVSASTSSTISKQFADSDFPCAVPDRYPTRLALPYDNAKLNTLHCFLRSELLEIFVVSKSFRKSPCHSPSSSVGRVGLRCVHCAMLRGSRREDREDAPMAVFYPKSIAEIYRLVTSWQRCHLRKCKNVPPAARARWQQLRETDRSRGKTHYWVTSAKQIGLMDCQSRAGGIRFAPDFDPGTLPAETMLTPSSKETAEKAAAITAKAQKIVSMANAVAASTMAVVPENAEMTDASNNAPTVMATGAIRI